MNALIVISLLILLFLLALPTINQLVSCFRDAPESNGIPASAPKVFRVNNRTEPRL